MRRSKRGRGVARRRPRRGWTECGSELVELALVGPVLLVLMFGIAEFGRALWLQGTVTHLAREGARYAIVRGSESGRAASAADVDAYVQGQAAGMTGLVVATTWTPDNDPGSVVQVRVDRAFAPIVPLVGLGAMMLTSTSRMVIAF